MPVLFVCKVALWLQVVASVFAVCLLFTKFVLAGVLQTVQQLDV